MRLVIGLYREMSRNPLQAFNGIQFFYFYYKQVQPLAERAGFYSVEMCVTMGSTTRLCIPLYSPVQGSCS